MLVEGKPHRTIWLKSDDPGCVQIIDQRALPHQFIDEDLSSLDDAIRAIRDMHVKGAPLTGATAAWGIYLVAYELQQDAAVNLEDIRRNAGRLRAARPPAVNLAWVLVIYLSESTIRVFSSQVLKLPIL